MENYKLKIIEAMKDDYTIFFKYLLYGKVGLVTSS